MSSGRPKLDAPGVGEERARSSAFLAVFERIAVALERLAPPLSEEEKFAAFLAAEKAAAAVDSDKNATTAPTEGTEK